MLDHRPAAHFEAHDQRLYEQLLEVARASALEQLSSGIAHEINQPLGAIATFAQTGKRMLARENPLVGAAIDVFQQISTQALSAGDEIHRIRASFTKPESRRSVCDPSRLLMETRPILDVLAARRDVPLQFDVPPGLPSVEVDPLQIQYVVLVLVQNAIDAASQCPNAQVDIALRHGSHAVRISVVDPGPGVPADARNKLFHPFKEKGVGLGLAAGQSIVQAHGGAIGFDAPDGGGSRFWFTLPVSSERT